MTGNRGELPFVIAFAISGSQPLTMARSWFEIEQHYRDLYERLPDGSFRDAFSAVKDLVSLIADGPLSKPLFGWTSMHDLCIQQVDARPYSGPFLAISPQQNGEVEFRYHDTKIDAQQWSRSVPPAGVIGRFEAFIDQLHWIARYTPKSATLASPETSASGPGMRKTPTSRLNAPQNP